VSKRWSKTKQQGAADTRTLKYTAWGLVTLGIVIVGVGMAMNTPAHEGATFGLLVIGGLVVFGGFLMHWLDRMDSGIAKEEAERPKRRHLLGHKRSRKRKRTAEDDFSVFEELDDLVDAPAAAPPAAAAAVAPPQPATIALKPPEAKPAPTRIEPVLRAAPPLERPRTVVVPAPARASGHAAQPAAASGAQTPRAVIQAVDVNARPAAREHSDLISAAIAKAEAARAQQLAQVAHAAEAEKQRLQAQAAYSARVAAEEEAARQSARDMAQNAAKAAAQQAARAQAESKARFDDLPAQRMEDLDDAAPMAPLQNLSPDASNEFRKDKGMLGRLADRFKRKPRAGREPDDYDEREDPGRWEDLPETAAALDALRQAEQQRFVPVQSAAPVVGAPAPTPWRAPVPTMAPVPPQPAAPAPVYYAAPAPAVQHPPKLQQEQEPEYEASADWTEDMLTATDWRSFENVVEALFRQAGFRSRILSLSEDGGADIGLFSRNQPGSPASVLHCHHSGAERIGVSRVRALRHVMSEHQVPRGQLVISGRFTSDAKTYAREHNIRLMDGPAMLALIRQRSPEQQAVLLELLQEGLV
jgi:hypothetical protein